MGQCHFSSKVMTPFKFRLGSDVSVYVLKRCVCFVRHKKRKEIKIKRELKVVMQVLRYAHPLCDFRFVHVWNIATATGKCPLLKNIVGVLPPDY